MRPTSNLRTLLSALCEDAAFAITTGGGTGILDRVGKRRADAYAALAVGSPPSAGGSLWIADMLRAVAPVHAPDWLPMAGIVREGISLEASPRGLHAILRSKPSEREALRIRQLGTLAVRVLRAVLAANGPLDDDGRRTLERLVVSLGLVGIEAEAMCAEDALAVERLEIYGELGPRLARAIVGGAWLAAAGDRHADIVRGIGSKLHVSSSDVEALRAEVVAQITARYGLAQAVVDGVLRVLSDQEDGSGERMAAQAAELLTLPGDRAAVLGRLRSRAPAPEQHRLSARDRDVALGIVWAAALHDDPPATRRAQRAAAHDALAATLGGGGMHLRHSLDTWTFDELATAANRELHA